MTNTIIALLFCIFGGMLLGRLTARPRTRWIVIDHTPPHVIVGVGASEDEAHLAVQRTRVGLLKDEYWGAE
jgi:hypothetical protein